ncbi:MAG: sirohydrochlorin chelatase [Betaproteobacteria bacterium]
MTPPTALILFAHGARDPRWALPLETVAATVRQQRPDLSVCLAYLESMSPSLLEAAETAVAQGAQRVQVVPLFLGAGGHVRKDLPVLLETLGARHPAVTFCLEAAIGEREAVIAAMAQSIVQANAPAPVKTVATDQPKDPAKCRTLPP